MSTNEYYVSPELMRELDSVLCSLESSILDQDIDDYGQFASAHSEYRGFRMATQLIKHLSLGLETESVISRITGAFDQPSAIYDVETEEEK